MKFRFTGARKRPELCPHHDAGNNNRMAKDFGAAATLSQQELRQLVAAMVD